MYESPNRRLARVLAIVNAPFSIVGGVGFFYIIYASFMEKDGLRDLGGALLIAVGLWLEYGYYFIAVRNPNNKWEKITWIVSIFLNVFAVTMWICFGISEMKNEIVLGMSLIAYPAVFLICSIIALLRTIKYSR